MTVAVALQVAGQSALLLGVFWFLRPLLPLLLDALFSIVGGEKCKNWILTQEARKGVENSTEKQE